MFSSAPNKQSTINNQQLISSGFTLIELLVVIVIISILAALLMFNFVGVRQRGRDAQRKSDLRQIQSALELHRADTGSYPTSLPSCGNPLSVPPTVYMQKIPCDPSGSAYSYNSGQFFYTADVDGATYTLAACLENTNDGDTNNTPTSPGGTGTCTLYFALDNP